METHEFKSKISELLPGHNPDAMEKLIAYADSVDREGKCLKAVFFIGTYVELDLVRRKYGAEIALKLFDLSTIHCLNFHEIRGAANCLQDGMELKMIPALALGGFCERTAQEDQESRSAVRDYQANKRGTTEKPSVLSKIHDARLTANANPAAVKSAKNKSAPEH